MANPIGERGHNLYLMDLEKPGAIWFAAPEHWPKASREYVFLASAFHEVGRVLFPDEWTGHEALPPQTPVFDAVKEATTQLISFAPEPVRRLRSGPALSMTDADGRGFTTARLEAAKLNAEQAKARFKAYCEKKWAEAKADLDAESAAAAKIVHRRRKTVAWIADKARNGELMTFGLWTGGGFDPWPLRPSIWNRKDDWELFANCEARALADGAQIACDYYLFFTRKSLTRALPTPLVTLKAERDVESWLREQFENSLTASTAKPSFKKEAQRLFESLSGDGFDRAWAAVIRDYPERAQPGRKRKTP